MKINAEIGTLRPNQLRLLAKASDLALFAGIADIFVFSPASIFLTLKSVQHQNISQKEKRAIVTKRFIDVLWSNVYWVVLLGMQFLLNKNLVKCKKQLLGKEMHTALGKKALDGLANIPSLAASTFINELIKPYYANIMTGNILKNYNKNTNTKNFVSDIYQQIGLADLNLL